MIDITERTLDPEKRKQNEKISHVSIIGIDLNEINIIDIMVLG